MRAWLPLPTPSSRTYSSSGSARAVRQVVPERRTARGSARARPRRCGRRSRRRAGPARSRGRSPAPTGDSACQYRLLKPQIRLLLPGPQSSSGNRGSRRRRRRSDCLIEASITSGLARRRSMAISQDWPSPVFATPAWMSHGSTRRDSTGSRKFWLYWIQSQTTRSADRSCGLSARSACRRRRGSARHPALWALAGGRRKRAIRSASALSYPQLRVAAMFLTRQARRARGSRERRLPS